MDEGCTFVNDEQNFVFRWDGLGFEMFCFAQCRRKIIFYGLVLTGCNQAFRFFDFLLNFLWILFSPEDLFSDSNLINAIFFTFLKLHLFLPLVLHTL